jgi:hypothetical protein
VAELGLKLIKISSATSGGGVMKAYDLNGSHIGQRFTFMGNPTVEGVFDGFVEDASFEDRLRVKIVDCTTQGSNLWSSGYWIRKGATVIPSRESEPEPKPSNEVRDKLAEYIQAEFSARRGGRVLNDRTAVVLADIFTELMEGGADAS